MDTERTPWAPGELTEHLNEVLYEAANRARNENPYDGRTREGRAWADGTWRTYELIRAALDIR